MVDAVPRDKFTSDGMRDAEASIKNLLDGSGAKGKGDGEMDAYCERMGARLVAAKKGEGAPLDRQEAAAEAKRVCAPLLWSDPQAAKGSAHNGKRGAGSCFGPDVAQRFLEKHHLKLIVRSLDTEPSPEPLPKPSPQSHLVALTRYGRTSASPRVTRGTSSHGWC